MPTPLRQISVGVVSVSLCRPFWLLGGSKQEAVHSFLWSCLKVSHAVTVEWPFGHSYVGGTDLRTSLFTSDQGLGSSTCKDRRGKSWRGWISAWWQKYPPHTHSLVLRIVKIKIIPTNPYITLTIQSILHVLTHLKLITSHSMRKIVF